jgi:hypothetical protein
VRDPSLRVELQPNPAADKITVNWEPALEGMEYTIINVQGQVVMRGSTISNHVDIATLTSGMYTIIVSSKTESRFARFLRS